MPETSFFVETETTRNVDLISCDLEERVSRALPSQLPAQQASPLLGLPEARAECDAARDKRV